MEGESIIYRWCAPCSHSMQIDVCRALEIGMLHNNAPRRRKKMRCTIDRKHRKCMDNNLANAWVRVWFCEDLRLMTNGPFQKCRPNYYVFKCLRIYVRMCGSHSSYLPFRIPSEWIGFYCVRCWGMYGLYGSRWFGFAVVVLQQSSLSYSKYLLDSAFETVNAQNFIKLKILFRKARTKHAKLHTIPYVFDLVSLLWVSVASPCDKQQYIEWKRPSNFNVLCSMCNVHICENNPNKIFGLNLSRMNCYYKFKVSRIYLLLNSFICLYECAHSVA